MSRTWLEVITGMHISGWLCEVCARPGAYNSYTRPPVIEISNETVTTSEDEAPIECVSNSSDHRKEQQAVTATDTAEQYS